MIRQGHRGRGDSSMVILRKTMDKKTKLVRDIQGFMKVCGSLGTCIAQELGKDGEETLQRLDASLKGLVELDERLNAGMNDLNETKRSLNHEREVDTEVLDAFVTSYASAIEAASQISITYNSHPLYYRIKKEIHQVLHPDGEYTGLVEDAGGGIELAVSSTINTICPISKTTFVRPVRNPQCNHVYSKAMIKAYIDSNRQGRCPVAGCRKNVSYSSLRPAKDVETYMERMAKQVPDKYSNVERL